MRPQLILLVVLAASMAAPVSAQAPTAITPSSRPGPYAGVRLDAANPPPHAQRLRRSRHRWVTWPGMEIRPGSGGRFFVQVTGNVETETHQEEGRVVIILRRARIHLANNRHPLESRFFNTPVNRAWLERRGRNVAFVLDLRTAVTPQVEVQEGTDGFRFIVVSFPAGNYIPTALRPPTTAPTQEPVGPGDRQQLPGDIRALDHERPPVLQGEAAPEGG